ncbi:MAG: hypothetical protein ACPLKQ_05010 [Candidatus Bathyarchaeales archaeon]
MKIEDIFTRAKVFKPEFRKRKRERPIPISEVNYKGGKTKPAKFEIDVLNYLKINMQELGIVEAYALKNMLVDCALKLSNGEVVLLEIKYALNWRNCCTARIEIQRFMAERLFEKIPGNLVPTKALIVFHHFSGDWNRQPKQHQLKNGWNFFYEEENALRKADKLMPVDIIQLNGKEFFNPLIMTNFQKPPP